MKIGIDIRLIGQKRTGDEQVFFHLVKNLAKIDRENEYSLFVDRDPEKNADLKSELEKLHLADNFQVVFLDSPNRFWWNFWDLPNYLKKNPVDVFHTQYIAPFRLPKEVKLVLTIHDISFNFFPQFIKKTDLFFLKTLIPRSLRTASRIIAVSEFTKKEIEKYYHIPDEKIGIAQNGVDLEEFACDVRDIELEKIREKYSLPRQFVLYIGTLQPRKNIPTLIEAMAGVDIPLVIAGNRSSHNFDQRIDEMIERLNFKDRIIFPGWIDEQDKLPLFKLADCFVFPSLYEGFGLPVLEAMAAGTPVVCSNQKALLEVGGNAVLAGEPHDSQKMTQNINLVLNSTDIRQDLIEKGKNQAQVFSWLNTAKKTLVIYQSMT